VDMIKKVNGKRCWLSLTGLAVPCKDQSTATVIQLLTREVMPSFGNPTEISSDNGLAFIKIKNIETGGATALHQTEAGMYISSQITRSILNN